MSWFFIYGIRELRKIFITLKLKTIVRAVMRELDQCEPGLDISPADAVCGQRGELRLTIILAESKCFIVLLLEFGISKIKHCQ